MVLIASKDSLVTSTLHAELCLEFCYKEITTKLNVSDQYSFSSLCCLSSQIILEDPSSFYLSFYLSNLLYAVDRISMVRLQIACWRGHYKKS